MIAEDYVSFEVAKLLKEKGFDCACKVWYSEYTSQFGGEKYTSIEFDNHNKFDENYKFICSAPTLQMAMKWLREIHNINIAIIPTRQEKLVGCGFVREYCSNIYNDNNIIHISEFITGYENACESAIKYCLENII